MTYVIAHGQLAAGDLDERMNSFYDGKYDVLLATTIVESGLDIPTANTMIVHRADMFGLSQLYQIRGRVGRAKTRAYCYLTTKPRSPLTPQATKRLRLLGSLDSLGAGFNLASHDLDLRGAGNLLGEEQSGHIREVGYELYQAMLEETIAKIKSGELQGLTASRRPMVAADQPWRAGADPRGLCPRSRRAAGPLPAAVEPDDQGGAGGLRGRTDRPLRRRCRKR